MTRYDHRPFGGVDDVSRATQVGIGNLGHRHIRPYVAALAVGLLVEHVGLGIFRYVYHYRPRTSGAGYMERTRHYRRDILGATHLYGPLGDRLCDADHIGFLKSVRTEKRRIDLSRDDNQRRRVHHGVAEAGHYIGGGRTGRYDNHTRASRHTGISLSGMNSSLFVPDKHVCQTVGIVIQLVVDRDYSSSGITEHTVDSLGYERFDERFGS